MNNWLGFISSVSGTALIVSAGALFRMHAAGIQMAEQIANIRRELLEERVRNDDQDKRHIAAEIMLSRIDENVKELLRRQAERV